MGGAFANTSYKVRLSKTDAIVVVRVYVGHASAADRDASILDLVKESLPVPEVVYVSPEGQQPNTCAILRWIDGVPLAQVIAE